MNKYELLLFTIENANKELNHYKHHKNNQDIYSIVSASLFRKIIEQITGMAACAENGLIGPSTLNYRGALEAYLSFQFITGIDNVNEDRKIKRAKAYLINYHQQQIDSYNNYLKSKVESKSEKNQLLKEVRKSQQELKKKEYAEVLREYNKVKKSINKNKKNWQTDYLPKWFSLYNGPTSFNGLARKLKFSGDKEPKQTREEMSILYGNLSVESHNFLALSDVTLSKSGEQVLSPVHSIKTTQDKNVHLIMGRALLTSSMRRFMLEIHPMYENELERFTSKVIPFLSYN